MGKTGSCVEDEAEPTDTLSRWTGGAPLAGSACPISVANMIGTVMARRDGIAGTGPGQARGFIRQRQQGFTFWTGESSARMFAQEKEHKGKYQTQADRKGEGNDGHKD